MTEKLFLKSTAVAKILGISKSTVVRKMRSGEIPFVRFGERIRLVPKAYINNLLELAEFYKEQLDAQETVNLMVEEHLPKDTIASNPIFLSPKQANALIYSGITTWDEVAKLTPTQVRGVYGIAGAGLKAIRQSLAEKGMKLRNGHDDAKEQRRRNLAKAQARLRERGRHGKTLHAGR